MKAGAAAHRRSAPPHDAVVAADEDVAVVDQQGSRRCRPAARTASSLPITSGSPPGLALVITSTSGCGMSSQSVPLRAAGRLVEQQQVQRRGRQHDAERRHARRDARRALVAAGLRVVAAARSGARPTRAARAPPRRSSRRARQRRGIGDHHREGLLLALLALAQPRDRVGIARVAGQVEAAQALDRDDLAVRAAAASACGDRIATASRAPVGSRTATRRGPQTGQALGCGVEAAIQSGSSYSRRQAGHSAKRAMLVFGRS